MNFFIITLIKVAVVAFVLLTTLAYLQWIERKVIAHVQLRVGPYRVGPHGLLQPLADVVKLITKEGVIPSHVNKLFYLMAPFVAVTLALISIAVIPFGPEIKIGPVDYLDAADRPAHRDSVRAGGIFHRRVRRGAGRLGVEQQILAAGRPAQLGPNDQL